MFPCFLGTPLFSWLATKDQLRVCFSPPSHPFLHRKIQDEYSGRGTNLLRQTAYAVTLPILAQGAWFIAGVDRMLYAVFRMLRGCAWRGSMCCQGRA
jgi:hypothetical protein